MGATFAEHESYHRTQAGVSIRAKEQPSKGSIVCKERGFWAAGLFRGDVGIPALSNSTSDQSEMAAGTHFTCAMHPIMLVVDRE